MSKGSTWSHAFVAIVLRAVLGISFLWAGSAHLFSSGAYDAQQSLVLAQLGVVPPAPETGSVPTEVEAPGQGDEDVSTPEVTPAENENLPAQEPAEVPAEPQTTQPQEDPPSDGAVVINASVPAQPGDGLASARRLYSIAVLLYQRAHPDPGGPPAWPAFIANPDVIIALAWAASLTEFLGGAMMLVGFLTRVWGVGLAGVMIVAMAMTTVGPAISSGDAFLWVFPPLNFSKPGAEWLMSWQPFLLQLALCAMALSVVAMGPGKASVDSLVFRRKDAGGSGGE